MSSNYTQEDNSDEKEILDAVITERHNYDYDTGICHACRYKSSCAHENAFEQEYRRNYSNYASVSDTMHSCTYDMYKELYCPDCEAYGESELVQAGVSGTEYHSIGLNNNTCTDCGYTTACTHPNTEKYPIYSNVHAFKKLDAKQHEFVGDLRWETACVDCAAYQIGPIEEKNKTVTGERGTYFFMELSIMVDGVETIQRYAFKLDENGEWVFFELTAEGLIA